MKIPMKFTIETHTVPKVPGQENKYIRYLNTAKTRAYTAPSPPLASLVVASVRDESVAVQFVTLHLIERIQLVRIGILV